MSVCVPKLQCDAAGVCQGREEGKRKRQRFENKGRIEKTEEEEAEESILAVVNLSLAVERAAARFMTACWGNKRMDCIPFSGPLHSIAVPTARVTSLLLYTDLCTLWSATICTPFNLMQFTLLVICRSEASVSSLQTRFCQLYQVIVCCHGDKNGAGSGFGLLDAQTGSFQVSAHAEMHPWRKRKK